MSAEPQSPSDGGNPDAAGASAPAAIAAPGAGSKRRRVSWVRLLGGLAGLAILVLIFVGVIPQFADYAQAWTAIEQMSWVWWPPLLVTAVFVLVSNVWPYQATLPGLTFWNGFTETETTAAISNTVPFGGAVSIGMSYRMFGSFGFSQVAISACVVATGLWNQALKLGMPILAVILLAVTGQSTAGVVRLAVFGLVVLVGVAVLTWWVFHSERTARAVGRFGDRWWMLLTRLVRRPRPNSEKNRAEGAVVRFREHTLGVVHHRTGRLTAGVLANQLAVFAVLLIAVRAVGIPESQVSFAAVLLAFSVGRLVGAIPITPGGLGTTDLALTGVLTAFGADPDDALAANLVWRAATYFPPILIGIVTYLIWRHRAARRSAADQIARNGVPPS